MGCLKLSYYEEQEALEKSPLKVVSGLGEKNGSSDFRVNYYPFGLQHAGGFNRVTSLKNNYLYNGKELQPSLRLDWYHYGERFYDPQLGRWHVIDPAGELFQNLSPYNYSFNNPVRFIDPDGMAPTEGGGTDPKELYGKKVDMSNAPARSVNAAGHPRNGPWFWRKMLQQHPEMFDEANRIRIRNKQSPHINETWIKHSPSHAAYEGKLVHHHIDQGKIATGIPEAAHRKHFSDLHTNKGGRPKGSGRLGKIGGAFSAASFLLDLVNSFRGDPHSLGMQFTAGYSTNKLYFDNETEQYFEVTSRTDIKDDEGNVIGQEAVYNTYSDYTYDEEAGRYVGVNKTGTYKATKYEGDDARRVYQQLISGGFN